MQLVDLIRSSKIIKRSLLSAIAAVLLFSLPLPAAYADSTNDESCTPVVADPNGIQKPTGSSSTTFHFNKCTGLYENNYYTWSPATKQYSPIVPLVYTCNQTDWQWHTTKWVYVASSNSYAQRDIVEAPPAGSGYGTCTKPVPVAAPASDNSGSSGGSNSVSGSNSSNLSQNDSTNTSLNNQISSTAISGNVLASASTSTGNATSGDAGTSVSIINTVGTTSALGGGQVATFTANIHGDVNGNLIVDPNTLQPAKANLDNTSDVKLNSQVSGQINNNVDVDAKSGDATASQNTTAGNVSSGSASAMASVVNMLNSYVSANQSFVGTVNIYGNLNGDILMPPKFIDDLIATGAPVTSVSISNSADQSISSSTATSIKNAINSSAVSGSAGATNNTESGNVTSGNTDTSVNIYNLTGHQIIGSNAILVFVNVMGTWVGVIMNAPAGTTSAMYGGNTTVKNLGKLAVDASTDNSITNNINAAATSGNALASDNTKVGDVTSGDAKTKVNVANISNDTFDLSGWFGILFINVFGNWYGNFGAIPTPVPTQTHNSPSATAPPTNPETFRFETAITTTPSQQATGPTASPPAVQLNATAEASPSHQAVLAANTVRPATTLKNQAASGGTSYYAISAALVIIGLAIYGLERVRSRQSAH